jgi:hypothetical protein
VQTSVVMPATMICFFPVSLTAAWKSALSHALNVDQSPGIRRHAEKRGEW